MSLLHPQSLRPHRGEIRRNPVAVPAAPASPERENAAIVELAGFLGHHYRTLSICATAGLLLGLAYAATVVPAYRATATIEVQDLNENFLRLKDVASASGPVSAANDLQTQLRILQSGTLIARVLNRLEASAAPTDVQVEAAARALQVRETRQSRIVDLTYESLDPEYAAAFVNELAQQYIDQNVESRLEISRGTSVWLERQLEEMRAKLGDSERRLQTYAEHSGLVVTNDAQRPDEEKLRQVQENLSKAQENRMMKQARRDMAVSAPLDSLEPPLGGALRDLRAKLAGLRQQRAELVAVYTPGFPAVKRLDAQIADLDASERKEANSVLQAIKNDYNDSVRRETLLAGSYNQQVRQVTAKASKAIQYGILKNEVNSNRELHNNMLQRAAEAKIASALRASSARLVDRAPVPRLPFKPNRFLSVLSGGTAGLLMGLVLVTARDRFTRRIGTNAELASFLKAPELGTVPDDPTPPMQAYRSILTSILFSSAGGPPPKVIAVVSAHQGEGKSQLVLNLADVLSQMKQRVLMIDGSRDGRLQELFELRCDYGLGDAAGLSDSGRGLLPYVTDPTRLAGVDLASIGTRDSNALDLVFSQGMEQLLEEMRTTYVLIDTSALLDFPDGRIFARMSDGAVLVAQSGKTSLESARTAVQRLRWDDSVLLGTVLNRA